jgi:hypothetical protein
MKGTRPSQMPNPSPTKEQNRTCAVNECETKLSVYNLDHLCWQHADVKFPNHRGKRLAPKRPQAR